MTATRKYVIHASGVPALTNHRTLKGEGSRGLVLVVAFALLLFALGIHGGSVGHCVSRRDKL